MSTIVTTETTVSPRTIIQQQHQEDHGPPRGPSTRLRPLVIPQNYAWQGSQWFPILPSKNTDISDSTATNKRKEEVAAVLLLPMYSPREIQDVLQRHNLFFMGDSTSRQNFVTLFHMAQHADKETITDIPIDVLEQDINLNKKRKTYACQDDRRDLSVNTTVRGSIWNPYTFFCFNTRMNLSSQTTNVDARIATTKRNGGMFDYGVSGCPYQLVDLVALEQEAAAGSILDGFLHEYDTMVVELGVWEVENHWTCHACSSFCQGTTAADRMRTALESLYQLSSPAFQVVWSTFGPPAHATEDQSKRQSTETLNAAIRTWFQDTQPLHMHLLDLERQIRPRSLGDARIVGDMDVHWGPAVRTLNAQMLTHILVTIDANP